MNNKIYIIIAVITLYILYYIFKDKNEYLMKGIKDSKKDIVIYKNIINNFKTGMEYTYSVWLYIEDWDYMNGSMKHILNTGTKDLSICSPGLFLHPTNNQLDVIIDTLNYDNRYIKQIGGRHDGGWAISRAKGDNKDVCMKSCSKNERCVMVSYEKKKNQCVQFKTTHVWEGVGNRRGDFYAKKKFNSSYDEMNNRRTLSINNVPIQRWFNIAVVLNNRNVNIYMDGKLAKSTLLPGIPVNINNNVFVNLNGGFKGKISDLIYKKEALGATEIYSLYRYGINNRKYSKNNTSGTSKQSQKKYDNENGKENKSFYKNFIDIFNNLF